MVFIDDMLGGDQSTIQGNSAKRPSKDLLPKPGKSTLPLERAGVMDVMTAVPPAPGDYTMTTNAEVQARTPETASASPAEPKRPKASKKATVAPQKPRVAPGKAKLGKKATPTTKAPNAKKAPKAQKSA